MGNLNSGLDPNKINTTTEHFLKNKHGIHITEKIHTTMNNKRTKRIHHHQGGDNDITNGQIDMTVNKGPSAAGRGHYGQQIVGYDSSSDSSYIHIPQFNADKKLSKVMPAEAFTPTSLGGPDNQARTYENYLKGPSQQSFYFNGQQAENVSQTNRPNFDQISDATKYVLNPNNLNKNAQNNTSTPETMNHMIVDKRTPTDMQNPGKPSASDFDYQKEVTVSKEYRLSNHMSTQQNVIHEEDYQQSSRGHLGVEHKQKLIHRSPNDASFKNNVNQGDDRMMEDDDQGRPCKHFEMQKASFESKSDDTETASEGH